MDVPKDPEELRNWMVEHWHQYGKTFTVFTPAEQPAPDFWEPELCPDMTTTLEHWRYLFSDHSRSVIKREPYRGD
jgi:hypothetical protein